VDEGARDRIEALGIEDDSRDVSSKRAGEQNREQRGATRHLERAQ
jgi:hypothetical protein